MILKLKGGISLCSLQHMYLKKNKERKLKMKREREGTGPNQSGHIASHLSRINLLTFGGLQFQSKELLLHSSFKKRGIQAI